MKKTFQLRPEGKHPDRVLDALKHEIRKYIKRERRRDLPEGVDFWDFDCRIGTTTEDALVVHEAELIGRLDAAAKAGAEQAYVEVLAKHGHRKRRPPGEATPQAEEPEA
ncbi:DUF6172 family protein [Variovorax sp. OV329]|uniref:DUF6172 family protein n=1 Tax=Variovorax sp. OV329 TaxID=1882825 RepID=UPI0008E98D4B|nr:DUF6172 family protein [Variovorax sp. OV329]SFM46065.1 hypothetical protein SAMN05444747_105308 [Variovorax sp. OV329]